MNNTLQKPSLFMDHARSEILEGAYPYWLVLQPKTIEKYRVCCLKP